MAIGRVGRGLVSPLLAVNFVVYLIILGLAAWSLNKYINGEQNHPRRLLDFLSSSSPSSSSFIFFKIKNSLRRLSNNYAKFFFFEDLGGNTSTWFLLTFALTTGAIGVCSVTAGLMHLRAWRSESLAAASSLAILSWSVTAIAVGYLSCHAIHISGGLN